MADCKKYNGNTWEHSLRKLTTATDTITTLPVDVYADGNTATIGISGNTVQSGTPTPTTPIQPSECGERTGNLLNNTATDAETNGVRITINPDKSITINGSMISREYMYFTIGLVGFTSGKAYTISGVNGFTPDTLQIFTVSTTAFPVGKRLQTYNGAVTRTASANEICEIRLFVYSGVTYENVRVYPFICEGSTPLPYEPYGVKIPISSGGTTTNVYLGEVESTRQIKKYEFTGDEAWGRNSGNSVFYLAISDGKGGNAITSMCTEYIAIANVAAYASMTDKSICIKPDGSAIWIKDTDISSTTDFKTHLSQQYAAGTPVTVWYVLATEQTGIVNEPLRKIGDYADTLSDVSEIPTTAGEQTFDVDTSLKPSEVQLTYKGWHKHSPKEYNNGSWA